MARQSKGKPVNQYADDSLYQDLPPLPKGDRAALYRLARMGQRIERINADRAEKVKNAEVIQRDVEAQEAWHAELDARRQELSDADYAIFKHGGRLNALGELMKMVTRGAQPLDHEVAYSLGEMIQDSAKRMGDAFAVANASACRGIRGAEGRTEASPNAH